VDLVVVLALLAASVALSRSIPVRQVVASSWAADAIAGWLQGATDFDRDGASGFFGGADCASFDATRGPTIAEIPGNGRDEDCDGADGIAQQKVSSVPSISGLFPSKLIKRYNIVLVVIDAVRADRFFGYRRKVTPELHRLATEAIVFEKAFSQSSATRISFPSFLTGRWATRLDWERHGGEFQLGRRETMIQEVLQRKGYSTAIVANEWFSDHASEVLRGFSTFKSAWFDARDYRRWRNGSAPVTTTRAIEFIEDQKKSPFFLTVYYEGPHAPYHDLTKRGAPSFGRKAVDRYDQEVWYADRNVGFLLDFLRSKPALWDNTVVVVTADHGEGFGEHGDKNHSRNCYVESSHVPLLVRVPGIAAAKVTTPVALVDLVPTMLEVTGIDDPGGLDGASLMYPIYQSRQPTRPIHCAIFLARDPFGTVEHVVRFGALNLVQDRRKGSLELFDTASDPLEERDLSQESARAADVERLRSLARNALAGRFAK
jgi:arylsulfatase A-like enzyme